MSANGLYVPREEMLGSSPQATASQILHGLGRGKLDYTKGLQTDCFQVFAEGPRFYNFTILLNELTLLIPYLGIDPKELFLN